ncbi:predicted protein [Uncinocarpus reesii 1704]|uniref:Uncharacterized protein n=1 Tax=Uncinocarpus reesii (strain UAMH 1704) TaxID=336963 RepID=C4JVU3_UNCRE|nr:uncharacterized protein UREG_06685 [Uncinocarpus reesii 1704]EEP81820.1 predicted protein [Uncinocarpus reesii 1704]
MPPPNNNTVKFRDTNQKQARSSTTAYHAFLHVLSKNMEVAAINIGPLDSLAHFQAKAGLSLVGIIPHWWFPQLETFAED